MTTTPVRTTAARLVEGDVFRYGSDEITVIAVTDLDSGFRRTVEVHGTDSLEVERWIDYGAGEYVDVISGPSTTTAPVKPVEVTSPVQRARNAVRSGKTRSLPASAALVLYAVAAAEVEAGTEWAPSTSSVATGAGLAISTTTGHLRSLAAKGLVRSVGNGGWVVAGA